MKTYQITACCDPYHARFHFNKFYHVPIKYDGATCVKWIENNGDGFGLSLEEAMNILDGYACELYDNTVYYDDKLIQQLSNEASENEEEFDTTWYRGAGWYDNKQLIYQRGDMHLRDDVVDYMIEEIE